jgi:hypothetical protein
MVEEDISRYVTGESDNQVALQRYLKLMNTA